jgi:Flp pilus assembly protein TadG
MKTNLIQFPRKLRRMAKSLRRDRSGVAAVEMALIMPLLATASFYGLELTNLAVTSLKVSQAAMALADNMSRVGLQSALATVQLRESDINDGFIGVTRQTTTLNLTQNGRIILSSLEQNATGGQWIHWQRCLGLKNVASSYGGQGTGATGTAFTGMGALSTAKITAPANSAVMFVEVFYDYQPLFQSIPLPNLTTLINPARVIRYEASFIVRDNRDLAGPAGGNGVYNPSPAATVKQCSSFTTS